MARKREEWVQCRRLEAFTTDGEQFRLTRRRVVDLLTDERRPTRSSAKTSIHLGYIIKH